MVKAGNNIAEAEYQFNLDMDAPDWCVVDSVELDAYEEGNE